MSAAWNADALPLDRRAKTLSSYAGDTALPGGRIDDDDKTIEDTAVRPDASSCQSTSILWFRRLISSKPENGCTLECLDSH